MKFQYDRIRSVLYVPYIHLAKRDRLNPLVSILIRLLFFALGMAVCMLVATLLIDNLNLDKAGLKVFYTCFVEKLIKTDRSIVNFAKDVAVLLCISLALAPAFKMHFWNIGAEGQTLVGVLAAYMVNYYLGGTYDSNTALSNTWLLILMPLGAMLAGAVWALIPALCKAKWNTNETLFTLMMNYIATFFVSFCISYFLTNVNSGKKIASLKTGTFPWLFKSVDSIVNPGTTWDISGTQTINDYILVVLIVLLLSVLLFVYMRYSKHGYEISVVGESPRTAKYVGINVKKVIIRTIVLSGMICGIAGWLITQIDHSVSELSSVNGQGFTAILVAWLGHFNPVFMIVTSAIVQFLKKGAGEIMKDTKLSITGDLTNVFIGIVLFFIIASEFFINYKIRLGFRSIEGAVE